MEEPANWCPPYQSGRQVLIKNTFGFSSSGFPGFSCLYPQVCDLLQETYSDPGFTAFTFDFTGVCQVCAREKDGVGLD